MKCKAVRPETVCETSFSQSFSQSFDFMHADLTAAH